MLGANQDDSIDVQVFVVAELTISFYFCLNFSSNLAFYFLCIWKLLQKWYLPQSCSSSPSGHWISPSHCSSFAMHVPSLQPYWSSLQPKKKRKKRRTVSFLILLWFFHFIRIYSVQKASFARKSQWKKKSSVFIHIPQENDNIKECHFWVALHSWQNFSRYCENDAIFQSMECANTKWLTNFPLKCRYFIFSFSLLIYRRYSFNLEFTVGKLKWANVQFTFWFKEKLGNFTPTLTFHQISWQWCHDSFRLENANVYGNDRQTTSQTTTLEF